MKTFVLIVVIGGQNISGYLSIKNFDSVKECTRVINYVKEKKEIKPATIPRVCQSRFGG